MAESGNDNKNSCILSNVMSQHINFKSNKFTKKVSSSFLSIHNES